jgi:hypothetical protein
MAPFVNFAHMKKLLFIICFVSSVYTAPAQCSMCKAAVESNMNNNADFVGKGLNQGILYLMAIPYLLGGVAYIIYLKNRKSKATL